MHTIETVKAIYAAFGRGDVPAILEKIADQVGWEYGWTEHEVPWLVPRKDKQGVAAFFGVAATALAFERFEVTHIVGDERLVVALTDLDARVVATGKLIRERGEAHIWHFDPQGRVIKFRHGADTLQQWRALQK